MQSSFISDGYDNPPSHPDYREPFRIPGDGKPWVVTLHSETWVPINVIVFADTPDLARYYVVEALLWDSHWSAQILRRREKLWGDRGIQYHDNRAAAIIRRLLRVGEWKHAPKRERLRWEVEPYDPTIISKTSWASNDHL
jgi:hypothetical protein